MKTMTCKQLAGACDKQFHAATFDEMSELCREHAMEMAEMGDKAHIQRMEEMKNLMTNPVAVQQWFEKVQKEFEALPEDN
jgi:hypothetical protein